MQNKYNYSFLGLVFFLLISNSAILAAEKVASATQDVAISTTKIDYKALKVDLKSGVRKIFETMNKNLPREDFGVLPDGLEIIEGNGFRGIKITPVVLEFRTYTWYGDTGLLDNYNLCKEGGDDIVAAVNGTFYSERGALGQLITDGNVSNMRQFSGRLSRCFLAAFRGAKDSQYWYLGETALNANELVVHHEKEMMWFNGPADATVRPDQLIGGGGWILRNRKDVHQEAVDRQFFRFRAEDQTSRKTVIAQDSDRNIMFLVFEAGFSLHQIAREFVKNEKFSKVQDAIFLDGGSSSCIVLKGKYLVAPLYMVDKARCSCIQVLRPQMIW